MATLTNSYQYLGRSSALTSTDGKTSYYLLLYGKTSSNRNTGIHAVTIKSVLAATISSSYYLYRQEYNGRIAGSLAFSGTSNPDSAWELSNISAGGVTYKLGTLLGEGTVNIDCSDGLAKDVALSCYYKFTTKNAASYTPATDATATVTVTATLPAIARQATLVAAPSFNDEENPTITYSNLAGTTVTSLQAGIFALDGRTAYVSYRDISKTGTSYTFQLTDAERATLMSACEDNNEDNNSVGVKFFVKTVIADTTYLSEPIVRTFSIVNANPIITASVIDVNEKTVALTGDNKKLIKYFSSAQATMSAEAQKGAAINEDLYIIRNGDNTGYGTTHTFENVEINEFNFSAEDSRENVGTATVEPTMIDYARPTCIIKDNKPDGAGNMTVECYGEYFSGSFGKETNSLTVQFQYRTLGGYYNDTWTNMTVTKSGNTYVATASLTGLEYKTTYFFRTRATDKLTNDISNELIAKSFPNFHWGEEDFVFEVPVEFRAGTKGSFSDTTIDGALDVTGDLRLKKSDSNYGNTLRFGDGSYCYISEPEDDVMKIYAKKLNIVASNGVYINNTQLPTIQQGTWTPSIDYITSANVNVVSSYTNQNGWYYKVGQTVTVGFFIKATCYQGFSTTKIEISGLPFTPQYSAAGGGMCAGAYVSGGYNFQCFVAESSGKITTRVQACNNTAATNLATSASGCCYPNPSGTVTLSGTITFMTNS